MTLPIHGSNPSYLYQALGIEPPKQLIDFSANINPLGPPGALRENWGNFFDPILVYPDPKVQRLTKRMSKELGIDEEWILFGNGASELIGLVGRLLFGKKVLIVQPAFAEYEAACLVNQCEVFSYQLTEPDWQIDVEEIKSSIKKVDAVFFCNPSNPTGIHYSNEIIRDLINICKESNCYLILDEAFYDYIDIYESIVPYIEEGDRVILLRSMTKMFAIPGLRLGYVVAKPTIISKLKTYQPHWSVNTVAMLAGEICLEVHDFQQETLDFISKERAAIFHFLEEEGYIHSASQTNFYLLRDPNLEDQSLLIAFLLKKGIVPRHTFNFSGLDGRWLRFAIKSHQENRQLMNVLKQWRNG
ncbi:threonine-phosphate decarboxylase CobD [Cytobacillus sp. Hz8]|uniref:threonine-phosphate decarboxylase CobD n=1 Tax=Cytobacillus sp. Hz8 TaxID=3347168 RepID=UPI0035E1F0C2